MVLVLVVLVMVVVVVVVVIVFWWRPRRRCLEQGQFLIYWRWEMWRGWRPGEVLFGLTDTS